MRSLTVKDLGEKVAESIGRKNLEDLRTFKLLLPTGRNDSVRAESVKNLKSLKTFLVRRVEQTKFKYSNLIDN